MVNQIIYLVERPCFHDAALVIFCATRAMADFTSNNGSW